MLTLRTDIEKWGSINFQMFPSSFIHFKIICLHFWEMLKVFKNHHKLQCSSHFSLFIGKPGQETDKVSTCMKICDSFTPPITAKYINSFSRKLGLRLEGIERKKEAANYGFTMRKLRLKVRFFLWNTKKVSGNQNYASDTFFFNDWDLLFEGDLLIFCFGTIFKKMRRRRKHQFWKSTLFRLHSYSWENIGRHLM